VCAEIFVGGADVDRGGGGQGGGSGVVDESVKVIVFGGGEVSLA